MSTISRSQSYEKIFTKIVEEKIEQTTGLSQAEFGRRLFASDEGARLWRRVRDPQGTAKPRKLGLSEAARCAEILEIEFPLLILEVEQELNKA